VLSFPSDDREVFFPQKMNKREEKFLDAVPFSQLAHVNRLWKGIKG
jgi:hypothetical protein